MKQTFSIVFLILACIALGCRKSPAGSDVKQSRVQVPDKAAQATVDDTVAARAAVRFLDRLESDLSREAPFIDPMMGFSKNVQRQSDEDAMTFSLAYNAADDSHGPFLIDVTVSRVTGGEPAPEIFFQGLNLGVDVKLETQNSEQEQLVADIIKSSLWVMRMAEPSVGGRFSDMLEPMVADIQNEIQGLAAEHPVLKGFLQDARIVADRDAMAFGVFYERNMGESTRRDPNGSLVGPDSIYISFHVREYIPMMNRWVRGSESWHVDVPLENSSLEVSWNMETHDQELPDVIYNQIIEPRIELLKQLDAELSQ